MNSLTKAIFTFAFSVCLYITSNAQLQLDPAKLLASGKLTVFNRTATVVENAINLSEDFGEGVAWINNLNFSTGIIELDVKGQDVFQHSFVGIAFHGLNDSSFNAVYFRPFNFKTDDSARRAHGVQYISLPDFTWERLRRERNGDFEKKVHPAPDPDDWFHVRLVVTASDVSVYTNNEKLPCLKVPLLNKSKEGKIGFYTADRSGGSFRNLSVKFN